MWTFLVVRSLRKGFLNGDSISDLQGRLSELPSDLEDFFKRMINSVDRVYQKRMAATFRVTLNSPKPLHTLLYSHMYDEGPHVASQSEIASSNSKEWQDEMSRIISLNEQKVEWQLNGRYKGLLESHSSETEKRKEVNFLHRTVRDFLWTKDMQDLFASQTGPFFNTSQCTAKAYLAQAKVYPGSLNESDLNDFMYFARTVEIETGICDLHLLDEMEKAFFSLQGRQPLSSATVAGKAVEVGSTEYISHKLAGDRNFARLNHNAAINLALKLETSLSVQGLRCLKSASQMLGLLSKKGGSPNSPSPHAASYGGGENCSIFRNFLSTFGKCLNDKNEFCRWVESVQLLIRWGADVKELISDNAISPSWYSQLLDTLKRNNPSAPMSESSYIVEIMKVISFAMKGGLNPSSASQDTTMWKRFLSMVVGTRAGVDWSHAYLDAFMELFLRHGADPRACFHGHPYIDNFVDQDDSVGLEMDVRSVIVHSFRGEKIVELNSVLNEAIVADMLGEQRDTQQPRRSEKRSHELTRSAPGKRRRQTHSLHQRKRYRTNFPWDSLRPSDEQFEER